MPVRFETERLRVRNYEPADAADAFEVYRDPEVQRFIGNRPPADVAAAAAAMQRLTDHLEAQGSGYGWWAMEERETGTVVGFLILRPLPGWPEIEIGWHLGRAHWGKGYVTEAAGAALEYGYHTLGLRRIVAVIHPNNGRSAAVARRLGMEHAGPIRAFEQDVELYVWERPEPGRESTER